MAESRQKASELASTTSTTFPASSLCRIAHAIASATVASGSRTMEWRRSADRASLAARGARPRLTDREEDVPAPPARCCSETRRSEDVCVFWETHGCENASEGV